MTVLPLHHQRQRWFRTRDSIGAILRTCQQRCLRRKLVAAATFTPTRESAERRPCGGQRMP